MKNNAIEPIISHRAHHTSLQDMAKMIEKLERAAMVRKNFLLAVKNQGLEHIANVRSDASLPSCHESGR